MHFCSALVCFAGGAGAAQPTISFDVDPRTAAGAAAAARASAAAATLVTAASSGTLTTAGAAAPQQSSEVPLQQQAQDAQPGIDGAICKLVALGFPREQCMQALVQAGGDVDTAASILFGSF